MQLEELLQFETIVIQCHDDPDADAIASGWALQRWLERQGRAARLIYGGTNSIQKANLRLMVELLNIPIQHVQTLLPAPDLLVCVDGTYMSRKVQTFYARQTAVIDHHKSSPEELAHRPALHEVRDDYGSCSTIVWDMMRAAGMRAEEDEKLATALYYGLFMDTHRLEDKLHSTDREMRNTLESRCDEEIFKVLRYNNLSQKELKLVGRAMAGARYDMENKFSLAEADPCDPNILGVIGDQMMEVEDIDVCVTYFLQARRGEEKGIAGARVSVRSCTWQVYANTLVEELTGGGGGHLDKAAGFLERERYIQGEAGSEGDGDRVFDYLWKKLKEHYSRQQTRLQVEAHVKLPQKKEDAGVLAHAWITLNGCLTVHNILVRKGKNGIFVAMPWARDRENKFYDVCFPVTAEMRRAVNDAVMAEYRRALGEQVTQSGVQEVSPLPLDKLELDVRIKRAPNGGGTALASVQIGRCFVVKDIAVRVPAGEEGEPSIELPGWQGAKRRFYIYEPTTPEMEKRLREAVLARYHSVTKQARTDLPD